MLSPEKRMKHLWIAAAVSFGMVVLGACGGGGGGGSSIAPGPQPLPLKPVQSSTTIPLSDVGSAIALPPVGGYDESITLTSNSAPAGTSLGLVVSTGVPKGVPAMPASFGETQRFLNFSISSSKTVTLSGFPGFELTIPPGLRWDGGELHLGFYNPGSGWREIGGVMLVGRTITFTPTKSALTLSAGVNYVVAPFACTAPSPIPSPVSTIVPLVVATKLPIPPLGGFTGNWVAAANNAPSGTTMKLTTYLSAPVGAPSPEAESRHPMLAKPPVNKGTVWTTFSLSGSGKAVAASETVTFDSFPAVSFGLPSGFDTSGVTFKLETFDLTTSALLDTETATSSGEGSVVESFPGTNSPFNMLVGHTYIWELIAQTGATPAPSPTPTPAPSLSPSPLPSPSPSPTSIVACTGTHLYVNDDTGGLFRYDLPLTSSSKATTLNTTIFNVWLAFDPHGNMYLTQFFGSVQEYVSPYTGSAVAAYSGAASGDPYGVAVNASGNVFIAEAGANQVIELSSITGSVIATISVSGPYALALDASDNLYIGNNGGIAMYAPPYTAPTPTKIILAGTHVLGVAFDSKADLFAGGNTASGSSVTVLAPPYGSANVIATITNGINGPLGMAVDCSGNVYVPNYSGDTITAYAPPYSSGPFATVPGSLPDADAIGP
jgi:hypothetical protein